MKKIQRITFFVCLGMLISGKALSQNLADQLEGNWEGKGVLMGAETDFKMSWDKVLDDQFLELTFTSNRKSNGDEILFHANAMYKLGEERWEGTWFDSRGVSFKVTGSAEDSTLSVEWGSPEIEQGRTVYSLSGENEMTVMDYVYQNGTYAKFGEALYHRVKQVDEEFGEPKVIGIGGIFFKSENPQKTRQWYEEHLGVISNEQGGSFVWRKFDDPDQLGFTVWHAFDEKDNYFNLSESEFMINYRVNNLDELIQQLERAGVRIAGGVEEYPYGRFAWILDPDGRKIELWEPNDEEYLEMLDEDGIQRFNTSN